jgi:hypothetical protein
MSKTFPKKSTKISMSVFPRLFWFYRVFGCFSAMGVQKHYKKRFTKKIEKKSVLDFWSLEETGSPYQSGDHRPDSSAFPGGPVSSLCVLNVQPPRAVRAAAGGKKNAHWKQTRPWIACGAPLLDGCCSADLPAPLQQCLVSTWKEQETKIKAKLEAKQGHALPCHHATATGGTFVFFAKGAKPPHVQEPPAREQPSAKQQGVWRKALNVFFKGPPK